MFREEAKALKILQDLQDLSETPSDMTEVGRRSRDLCRETSKLGRTFEDKPHLAGSNQQSAISIIPPFA
jgi:hypothetical protein